MALFPPILNSSLAAFVPNSDPSIGYKVYFALPNYVSANEIKHTQIRLLYQASNSPAATTPNQTTDNIIYRSFDASSQYDTEKEKYFAEIFVSDLIAEEWILGIYYKVQVRFGSNDLWTTLFYNWHKELVATRSFSDWSTVMLIKPIAAPEVTIVNNVILNNSNVSNIEDNVSPLFTGRYYSSVSNEKLDKYKFSLYQNDKLIETSGWIQNNLYENSRALEAFENLYINNGGTEEDAIFLYLKASSINSYRFKTTLSDNTEYKVTFDIITVNLYEASAPAYVFTVSLNYNNVIPQVTLQADDSSIEALEEGCINIYLSTKPNAALTGNYILTRYCEKDNFAVSTDLTYINCISKNFAQELIYSDMTIESGVRYKYAFQYENLSGVRSMPVFAGGESAVAAVDLQYSYLFSDGKLLKLKFNNEMSSFKYTHLTNKQDTIGSKFPVIAKNGYANYAEFPINALISMLMDEHQKFFKEYANGYYYDDELVIPKDKYTDEYGFNTFNSDLSADNHFIERKFREKVTEFINSNDYFLYRSPTEGNLIVSIINYTMLPNKDLSRMISAFTSTAYEVADFSFESLLDLGLIYLSTYISEFSINDYVAFGQVHGLFKGQQNSDGSDDILDIIKQDVNNSNSGINDFSMSLNLLTKLTISLYPVLDLTAAINEATMNNNIDLMLSLMALLEELNSQDNSITAVFVYSDNTSSEITISGNNSYTIDNEDVLEGITHIYLKDNDVAAAIIDYEGSVIFAENQIQQVLDITENDEIDLVYGIFTTTDRILNNYELERIREQVGFEINSGDGEYDPETGTMINSYISGIYLTNNILDVLYERIKNNIGNDLTYINGEWFDGEFYYDIKDIYYIKIEADQGTALRIGTDETNYSIVYIGANEQFTLTDLVNNNITYLCLDEPLFAIIDFNYKVRQIVKGAISL